MVALKMVSDEDDLMIITASGTLIRTSVDGISTYGRYAQGVKLIHIREDDEVATVARVEKNEDAQQNDESQQDENFDGH